MKTTSIYIAAKYQRRFDLQPLATKLQSLGFNLTCQWLFGGEEEKLTITQKAVMDVEDVRRATTLVFIGEPQSSENRGGGRWFEFGMAHALGKRCIAVLDLDPAKGGHDHLPGGHESVFTGLPDVEIVTSQDELVSMLEGEI